MGVEQIDFDRMDQYFRLHDEAIEKRNTSGRWQAIRNLYDAHLPDILKAANEHPLRGIPLSTHPRRTRRHLVTALAVAVAIVVAEDLPGTFDNGLQRNLYPTPACTEI